MTGPRVASRGRSRGFTAEVRAELEETMAVVILHLPGRQAAHWCARAMRASTPQSFLGNGEVGLRQALSHELQTELQAEVSAALERLRALRRGTQEAGAASGVDAPSDTSSPLQRLREQGARLGRTPAVPDFRARPEALRSIRRAFGGLRQATLLAGLVPARGCLPLTRAELLQIAVEAAASSGSRKPALAVLERTSGLSRRQLKLAIREHFGSHRQLLLEVQSPTS